MKKAALALAALLLAAPASARAGDITDALIQGAVGLAIGQLGGQGSVLGLGFGQPQRGYDDGYDGYGNRDDYGRERRIYEQLARRYGHRAVDDCFDSRRCTERLAEAWNSGSQRRIDRVLGRR